MADTYSMLHLYPVAALGFCFAIFPRVIAGNGELSSGCLLCADSVGATTEYSNHFVLMCSKLNDELVKSKAYVANRMGIVLFVAIHKDVNRCQSWI